LADYVRANEQTGAAAQVKTSDVVVGGTPGRERPLKRKGGVVEDQQRGGTRSMRTEERRMKSWRASLILAAGLITASCSEGPATDGGKAASDAAREQVRESPAQTPPRADAPPRPGEGKIGRDVVAFVRATRIVPATGAGADCPGCPPGGTEVVTMREMKTDAVSCSGDTCNVVVTIRAVFNPGSGERMAGGLTAWIPPEQRSAYLSGQTPADEQTFRVQITYRHRNGSWHAVEFDRAPAQ
jgi:hypothetical protein